jgi:hypothetical protein
MCPEAVLALTAAETAGRLGLLLVEGCDDLDSYRGAAVEAAGETAAIVAHRGNPGGRAQIYLVPAPGYIEGTHPDGAADARRRVDAVIAALGLPGDSVAWRRGEPMPEWSPC